jgi:hypothetical protein
MKGGGDGRVGGGLGNDGMMRGSVGLHDQCGSERKMMVCSVKTETKRV